MTQVKIMPAVSYKVEFERDTDDWTTLGIFKKESEWEGFIKLTDGLKQLIVRSSENKNAFDLFANLFGDTKEKDYIANVVSATEGIFPKDD